MSLENKQEPVVSDRHGLMPTSMGRILSRDTGSGKATLEGSPMADGSYHERVTSQDCLQMAIAAYSSQQ